MEESIPTQPSSKVGKAAEFVRKFMSKEGYGVYNGTIRRKAKESVYTYVHKGTVKEFLLDNMDDPAFADIVVPVWTQVSV